MEGQSDYSVIPNFMFIIRWDVVVLHHPHLILKHLISLVVSLAQIVSPNVALPAELVVCFLALFTFQFLKQGLFIPNKMSRF